MPVIIKIYLMPKFYLIVVLIFLAAELKAQTWELGGSFGGAGYIGDLNEHNPLKVSGPSLGGFVQRNFDGYLSAKIDYTYGTISAADSNSSYPQLRERNLSFTTTLNEISLLGEFNFMSYIPEAGKNKFTPFIYLGFSAVKYVPRTTYDGVTYDLRGYETEGEKKPYANFAYSLPYGAGVKYNITGKWTLAADLGYRNTNTSYLDDVSGFYPAAGPNSAISKILSNPSNSAPGSQRGDINTKDTYFFIQFSISYTFVTQKCYFQ
jgi:hypothetical protein